MPACTLEKRRDREREIESGEKSHTHIYLSFYSVKAKRGRLCQGISGAAGGKTNKTVEEETKKDLQ